MLQLELHDSECAELRQVARQAVGRVSERAHFVLLSGQGYSAPKIGELMGYEVQTVRTWTGPTFRRGVEAYVACGCAGLDADACAAQWAAAENSASDGGSAGPGRPAATQLRLCAGVLDGGVAGVASGGSLSALGEPWPSAAGAAAGRLCMEAAQTGPGAPARSAGGRKRSLNCGGSGRSDCDAAG